MKHFIERMRLACQTYDWQVPEAAYEQWWGFVQLLQRWNRIHNLTAIRDMDGIIQDHLIDSLSCLPYLREGSVLDVGCGAGLPGLVLAIARPNQSFTLLDSRQKKINFVEHVVLSLGLKQVTTVCGRVEQYKAPQGFDQVIARAFAPLGTFVALTRHLCRLDGQWIAMKGDVQAEELSSLPGGVQVERIVPVHIGDVRNRHLVILQAS